MRTTTTALLALALSAGALAVAQPANAVHEKLDLTGLTANDHLVTFEADTKSGITADVKVTGLGDDDLVAIDYRPANGGLYGVATGVGGARLYLINPTTGAAVPVSAATLPIAGDLSIDFNPVVDRLRVVSSDGTNLRVHPDTGAVAATDAPLNYAATDANAGATPVISGVAYTKSDTDPTTATELFDIDAALDTLALQNPPNSGTLTTRGALPGATKSGKTGFDIYTRDSGGKQDWAFVSLFDKGVTSVYEISLTTGAATTNFVDNGAILQIKPHLTDLAVPVDQGSVF